VPANERRGSDRSAPPGQEEPAVAAVHLSPLFTRGRRALLTGLASAAWLHLAVLLLLVLADRSGKGPRWWAVFGLTGTAGVTLAVRQRPAQAMHGARTALVDAALLGGLMAGSLWCTSDPLRTRLALAGLPYVLVLVSPSKYQTAGTALATAATYGAVFGVTAWSQFMPSAGRSWDWASTALIWWPLGLTAIGTHRVARLLRAQAEAHRRISAGARTDPLTGLANRTAFFADAERSVRAALSGGRPCSLLLADLDGLKDINDSFGHATGDAALRHMGQMLATQAVPGDLIARLGGDEFAVLVHHAPGREEEAIARYTRLLDGTLYHDAASGWTLLLSGSWGAATAGRHGLTLLELFAYADEDLIRRKSLPRPQVVPANVAEPPFIPRGRRALADTVSSLLELARDVAAATDGDDLLLRAATRAAELVGASTAAVAVVRAGQRRGIRARRSPTGWHHEPASFPGEHSILQNVLTTGSPYICNDTTRDPHADQEAARRLGIRNCLCVPLRGNDGAVIGTVFLTNKLGRAPFTEQDLRLALAFADLAAAALQKIEALAAARQEAGIVEALLRVPAPVRDDRGSD
jgi:diguanylate cyclase (GGDEF)-like protein